MAEIDEKLRSAFAALNDVLNTTSLEDVSSEDQSSFEELPDGYYLSEVEKAELTVSKSSGAPMVAMTLKVVENGVKASFTGDRCDLIEIPKTVNRKIFKYFVIDTPEKVKKFVSDMLKFENNDGQPILDKEYFTTAEVLQDALDILIGMRIYINVQVTEKNGTISRWNNFVSWKRANMMELPC